MDYSERLFCHSCNSYQIFTWDLELTGNQVFYCPNCGHPHYRILEESTRVKIAIMPDIPLCCMSNDDLKEMPIQIKNGNVISNKRWATYVERTNSL